MHQNGFELNVKTSQKHFFLALTLQKPMKNYRNFCPSQMKKIKAKIDPNYYNDIKKFVLPILEARVEIMIMFFGFFGGIDKESTLL